MSTTIRVKMNTLIRLKEFYKEPYCSTSLDQVIKFLLNKAYLFELVVQKFPDLIEKINGIIREEKIRRLEVRVKDLKESRVNDQFIPEDTYSRVKPCILNVNLNVVK